ncbi:MAG TPA: YetF domain-containing protein [Candidatus Limnocylindrales bacterium]|nr:YetF domain-containing protein [Candidatus Limnocylindrales bacterium]
MTVFGMDLEKMFGLQTPVPEMVARGTITYIALFVLLRLFQRRQAGSVGMADLLVLVLLADAAQNALADDYRSITDGLILVATILFWSVAFNWLGYRVPAIERIVHPRPLPLIEDGELRRRNMRREFITEDELLTELRLQGLERFEDVRAAYIEGNGRVSVIPRREADPETGKSRRALAP